MLKLQGVMPALVTPYDAKGAIDFVAFEKHLTALRAAGVSGWVPCGSSGEYNLMSDDERDQVLQFVKNFAKPGEILIAGTNAPSTCRARLFADCRVVVQQLIWMRAFFLPTTVASRKFSAAPPTCW